MGYKHGDLAGQRPARGCRKRVRRSCTPPFAKRRRHPRTWWMQMQTRTELYATIDYYGSESLDESLVATITPEGMRIAPDADRAGRGVARIAPRPHLIGLYGFRPPPTPALCR